MWIFGEKFVKTTYSMLGVEYKGLAEAESEAKRLLSTNKKGDVSILRNDKPYEYFIYYNGEIHCRKF